jgi:thiosulfate dehydrogenase (quinone) large subunit
MAIYTVQQSSLAHYFTNNTKSAALWLLVRLYLGYEWFVAGWDKVHNPAWFGSDAGSALTGFVQNALTKTVGAHPDVQMWYASFLQQTVLPHVTAWSNMVALGEMLVGLGLIVGMFTAVAAFFGFFMNLNFLLAGAVSLNPIWLLISLGLIAARRVASYYGLNRFVAPYLKRFYIKQKYA